MTHQSRDNNASQSTGRAEVLSKRTGEGDWD